MKPTHHIASLHLDLCFESDAPRPQPMAEDDVLALARAHILPALAETLEQEDDGRSRQIARLDIDLGACAAQDYATEIPVLLARLLREALARHDSEAAGAGAAALRPAAGKRQPLEYFLLTGRIASTARDAAADASRPPHERLLAPWLAAASGEELNALLRRCAASPDAVRRLAQQFDAASLRRLVLRVETPARAAAWLSLVDDIDAALAPDEASRRQQLRQFWEILLNEILGGAAGAAGAAARSAPAGLRQAAAVLAGRRAVMPPQAIALLQAIASDPAAASSAPPSIAALEHGERRPQAIPSRIEEALATANAALIYADWDLLLREHTAQLRAALVRHGNLAHLASTFPTSIIRDITTLLAEAAAPEAMAAADPDAAPSPVHHALPTSAPGSEALREAGAAGVEAALAGASSEALLAAITPSGTHRAQAAPGDPALWQSGSLRAAAVSGEFDQLAGQNPPGAPSGASGLDALWREVHELIAVHSAVDGDAGQPKLLARAVRSHAAESRNPTAFLQAVLIALRDKQMLDLDDIEEHIQSLDDTGAPAHVGPLAAGPAIGQAHASGSDALWREVHELIAAHSAVDGDAGQPNRLAQAVRSHTAESRNPTAFLQAVLIALRDKQMLDLDDIEEHIQSLGDTAVQARGSATVDINASTVSSERHASADVGPLAIGQASASGSDALWHEVHELIAAHSSVDADAGQPNLLAQAVRSHAAESRNPTAFLQAVLIALRDKQMLDLDQIEEHIQNLNDTAVQALGSATVDINASTISPGRHALADVGPLAAVPATGPAHASGSDALWREVHELIAAHSSVDADAGQPNLLAQAVRSHAAESRNPTAFLQAVLIALRDKQMLDLDDIDEHIQSLDDTAAPADVRPLAAVPATGQASASGSDALWREVQELIAAHSAMDTDSGQPNRLVQAVRSHAAESRNPTAFLQAVLIALRDKQMLDLDDIEEHIQSLDDTAVQAPGSATVDINASTVTSGRHALADVGPLAIGQASASGSDALWREVHELIAAHGSVDVDAAQPNLLAQAVRSHAAESRNPTAFLQAVLIALRDKQMLDLDDIEEHIQSVGDTAVQATGIATVDILLHRIGQQLATGADDQMMEAIARHAESSPAPIAYLQHVLEDIMKHRPIDLETLDTLCDPPAASKPGSKARRAGTSARGPASPAAAAAQAEPPQTKADLPPANHSAATLPPPPATSTTPDPASAEAPAPIIWTSQTGLVERHGAYPRRVPGGALARALARQAPARRAALTAMLRDAGDDIGQLAPATIQHIVQLLAGSELPTITRYARDVGELAAQHLPHLPETSLEAETAQFDLDWFFIQGKEFAPAAYAHALAAWLCRHIAGAAAPLHETLHSRLGIPQPAAQPARPAAASAPMPADPDLEIDALLVDNAGLVLIGPYMPRLFAMLDLTEAGQFKNAEAAERAVHLLQCVAGGPSDTPEAMLGLNKILCGVAAETAIAREISVTDQERDTIEMMLRAIIEHWKKIGNTTPDGLRQAFLQRAGHMHVKDEAWHLNVEPGTFDMLLDSLPWSFSIIKHPWMERAVHVNWR